MSDKISFIGGDGYAAEIINYVEDNENFEIEVYEDSKIIHDSLTKYKAGTIDDFIKNFEDGNKCFLAIQDPQSKKIVYDRIKHLNIRYYSFIHPTALISSSAELGSSIFLYPYTVIANNAKLGDFVVVNSYSAIGHDSSVGNFSFLSAHVDITGNVSVDELCFFGSGSRTIPNINIAKGTRVGA